MVPRTDTEDRPAVDEKQSAEERGRGEAIYTAVVGVILLGLGLLLSWQEKSAASAATLVLLGACALIAAPLIPRVEELQVGAKGVALSLRRKATRLVGSAPPETLGGVIPLLESSEVSVRQLTVPRQFDGKTLTDPLLGFLRPELHLSVIAVEDAPGHWLAGGAVSDHVLKAGSRLLATGHPEILNGFADLPWGAEDGSFKERLAQLKARAAYLDGLRLGATGRG